MKNSLKKVLSCALAACVCLSLTITSFAASGYHDSIASVDSSDNGTTVGVDADQNKKTEYYAEITSDTATNTVNVYATQASTFSVVIPKTIILDGAFGAGKSYEGKYEVIVKGNIAGDESVNVVPDASFALQQAGKTDLTASVTQTVQHFRDTTETVGADTLTGVNLNTPVKTTGTVAVQGVTAGSWHGTFNFAIDIGQAA